MSVVGRTGWRVADQIASGLSNVSLAAVAAHMSSPSDYGVIASCLATIVALVAMTRASLGNLIVQSTHDHGDATTSSIRHSVALICTLGPLLVIIVSVVGCVTGGTGSPGLVALMALAAPCVIVQDILRYGASALARPALACAADTLWLAFALVPAIEVLGLRIHSGPTQAAAWWMMGALSSALTIGMAVKGWPALRTLGPWTAHHRAFLFGALGGSAFTASSNVARVTIIGASRGPTVVGALAAGQLIMTPLNLLVALIPFAATPVISRRRHELNLHRAYAGVAVAALFLSFAWWMVCISLPDRWGEALLGEQWEQGQQLMTPMAILSMGVIVNAAAVSLLLVLGRAGQYSKVALFSATMSVISTVVTLAAGGSTVHLAWSQTAVVLLGATLSWRQTRIRRGDMGPAPL